MQNGQYTPEVLAALNGAQRLCEKIKRANDLQHSNMSGRIPAEDWSELYQLELEVREQVAIALNQPMKMKVKGASLVITRLPQYATDTALIMLQENTYRDRTGNYATQNHFYVAASVSHENSVEVHVVPSMFNGNVLDWNKEEFVMDGLTFEEAVCKAIEYMRVDWQPMHKD